MKDAAKLKTAKSPGSALATFDRIDKKFSRRTINIFFLIAFKLDVIDTKVYVDLGKKEKDI